MRAKAIALTAMLLFTAVLCCACPDGARLPADPGLAADDFGIGITLGMDYGAAQGKFGTSSAKREVLGLTREELLPRSPYTERAPEKDLVIVLHSPSAPSSSNSTALVDIVDELRFYLAAPGLSSASLLGESAAALKPAEVIALLGEPTIPPTESSDGRTHLTYYFASAKRGQAGIKLVTSHEADGHCFAFAVNLEPSLPR